jgi:hypothetical protein
MARVYGIQKWLTENHVDQRLIKHIIKNQDLVGVITRMENSLDSDMISDCLDSCACLGSKDYLKKCENTGKELADKPLYEKIRYLNNQIFTSERITLNNDGSMTAVFVFQGSDRYRCTCYATISNGVKISDLAVSNSNPDDRSMPLSYCFCCAGSFRRHLQLMLDVSLKTKTIISSPINSHGEKPCEFVYQFI